MPRVWLITRRRQAGFSAVEALLAATVFGMLVTGLIGAIVYGRSATSDSGDRQQAMRLADEGLDAVRNIRNASYSNLTNSTLGLVQSGGVWTLSGTSDTTGIFTRTVTISSVDSVRKSVTVTVSWGNGHQVSVQGRLTNWLSALPVTNGPTIMAYSKATSTPFYRTWNGSAWSTEGSAGAVGGSINYVVLKSARTRNEAILGTEDSTGAIYIQIWNGSSWTNKTQVGTGSGFRDFDIVYERSTDRAMIVYNPNAGVDFAYRIWDGSTLSAATTVTAPPTTGVINWIAAAANPTSTSNEVSMMLLDSNSDVYGMAWTGSTWSTMGTAAVWDASASISTRKAIDVAYEQSTGRAMFMWGSATSTNQKYRIWNGTTLTSATTLAIAAEGGVTQWLRLTPRSGSAQIMLGVQDAAANLNTRVWSGSAWDTATQHAEHDSATENIQSENFDIMWETAAANAGKAWLMWGDGATVSVKQWSGSAWGSATVLSGSDDTSFIRLRADPSSGAVFAGIYQNSTAASGAQDINERHLTGGGSTWSAKTQIWGGPTDPDPVSFQIDIAMPGGL